MDIQRCGSDRFDPVLRCVLTAVRKEACEGLCRSAKAAMSKEMTLERRRVQRRVTQLRDAKVDPHSLAQRIANKVQEEPLDTLDLVAHCLLLLPFFTPLVRSLCSASRFGSTRPCHMCVCMCVCVVQREGVEL